MYAPESIRALWNEVKKAMPQAELGGITGSGKPGYHSPVAVNRARYPGNYSIQRPDDLRGDFNAGRALDITLRRPQDMTLLTTRLIKATQANDGRLWCVREFFGTTNGRTVTGMDVRDKRWVTSDPSHLWHIHLSFYTVTATNKAQMMGVADVLLGRKGGGGGKDILDTMDRRELNKIIDDRSRNVAQDVTANALRAVLTGGNFGYWTQKRFPIMVKDKSKGVLDRLFNLERKVK